VTEGPGRGPDVVRRGTEIDLATSVWDVTWDLWLETGPTMGAILRARTHPPESR